MKMKKTKRTFDCVAFKESAQREIQRSLEGMTPEERLREIERRAETGPFAGMRKRLKRAEDEKAA